ncbi:ATP phosphoribosyltransferase regulatory subunit [Salinibacterium sp.]|uniref:histidine--tRNA ligase n=2 Tax=Salinibacterium sp. TaxID=1915057 RepID=UPI00286CE766|nr:ATP phosphoribosyltransferase regulatory subunit [Salinibacterium sp.]
MASSVTPPRGMRDFLPAEKARRERVLAVIRDTYRAHGFDEIETPVMEDSDRLHAGLGGDNEKLAFAVMKRALTSDDLKAAADPLDLADLGLRFDLTVPLARFYASHRAELPTIFRSIQIAPVWRAERPQKGRFRQFMQCDIDIIGEAGPMAEIELISATAATLDALGLEGCSIRINDRRLLTSALELLGFPPHEHEPVLITIDKLDKLGHDGVITELRDRGFPAGPVDALEAFFRRPVTMEYLPFGEAAIRKALPQGVDSVAVTELAAIGLAVEAARGGVGAQMMAPGAPTLSKPTPDGSAPDERSPGVGLPSERSPGVGSPRESTPGEMSPGQPTPDVPARPSDTAVPAPGRTQPLVQFDPWLVRGMGYYTGAIFEVAHPSLGYSLGGGGRYDGMIGRFLGSEVPAAGFSLGFERLVDLVELQHPESMDAAALIHDGSVPPAALIGMQTELIRRGIRVRLVRKPRNMTPLLTQLAASGFSRYAVVDSHGYTLSDLKWVLLSH